MDRFIYNSKDFVFYELREDRDSMFDICSNFDIGQSFMLLSEARSSSKRGPSYNINEIVVLDKFKDHIIFENKCRSYGPEVRCISTNNPHVGNDVISQEEVSCVHDIGEYYEIPEVLPYRYGCGFFNITHIDKEYAIGNGFVISAEHTCILTYGMVIKQVGFGKYNRIITKSGNDQPLLIDIFGQIGEDGLIDFDKVEKLINDRYPSLVNSTLLESMKDFFGRVINSNESIVRKNRTTYLNLFSIFGGKRFEIFTDRGLVSRVQVRSFNSVEGKYTEEK